MTEKRRATVKIMENVTDEELDTLIKGLKKIQGFDFSIDSFVIIKKGLGGSWPVLGVG